MFFQQDLQFCFSSQQLEVVPLPWAYAVTGATVVDVPVSVEAGAYLGLTGRWEIRAYALASQVASCPFSKSKCLCSSWSIRGCRVRSRTCRSSGSWCESWNRVNAITSGLCFLGAKGDGCRLSTFYAKQPFSMGLNTVRGLGPVQDSTTWPEEQVFHKWSGFGQSKKRSETRILESKPSLGGVRRHMVHWGWELSFLNSQLDYLQRPLLKQDLKAMLVGPSGFIIPN